MVDLDQQAAGEHKGAYSQVKLLRSGPPFFEELKKAIASSRLEIHFQSYILKWDETGRELADALTAAARRGVKVRVLLDAYGSSELDMKKLAEQLGGNSEARFFRPLFSNGRFHIGRRLHHKVVVIDGETAFVGGINISNAYSGQGGEPPWLDFALRVEGGPSRELRSVCEKKWFGRRKAALRKAHQELKIDQTFTHKKPTVLRAVHNDFLRNRNEIAATYRNAFRTANESIDIVGGYFLPGGRARRLLKAASRRGVRIRVILSERSDVVVARLAREYLYAWMLRNGIRLYEYTVANVHGKALHVDKRFLSIGSYDLNNLSTYSNIETNLNANDHAVSIAFDTAFEQVIENDCMEITTETLHRRRGPVRSFLCWLSYRITKTLFGISYLMAGSEDRD